MASKGLIFFTTVGHSIYVNILFIIIANASFVKVHFYSANGSPVDGTRGI
jgi:hypothetical protein